MGAPGRTEVMSAPASPSPPAAQPFAPPRPVPRLERPNEAALRAWQLADARERELRQRTLDLFDAAKRATDDLRAGRAAPARLAAANADLDAAMAGWEASIDHVDHAYATLKRALTSARPGGQ